MAALTMTQKQWNEERDTCYWEEEWRKKYYVKNKMGFGLEYNCITCKKDVREEYLFDLRRWGNSASMISEYISNEARIVTPFGVAANAYQAKHDLSPIPLNAIDQSQGVIQQNTGY